MNLDKKYDLRHIAGAVCTVMAVVFLLYPFLHELGHALVGWLLGGEVIRITIYPSFYTECLIRPDQLGCYIMTAMAGILFPLLISALIGSGHIGTFLTAFCLRVMSAGYALDELVSVSQWIMGSRTEISDLSVLIRETQVDPYAVLILAGFLLILSLIALAAMAPITRVMELVNAERECCDRERSCYSHWDA